MLSRAHLCQVIDVNLFSLIAGTFQPYLPDWKNYPDLH